MNLSPKSLEALTVLHKLGTATLLEFQAGMGASLANAARYRTAGMFAGNWAVSKYTVHNKHRMAHYVVSQNGLVALGLSASKPASLRTRHSTLGQDWEPPKMECMRVQSAPVASHGVRC